MTVTPIDQSDLFEQPICFISVRPLQFLKIIIKPSFKQECPAKIKNVFSNGVIEEQCEVTSWGCQGGFSRLSGSLPKSEKCFFWSTGDCWLTFHKSPASLVTIGIPIKLLDADGRSTQLFDHLFFHLCPCSPPYCKLPKSVGVREARQLASWKVTALLKLDSSSTSFQLVRVYNPYTHSKPS